jgi:hypothetical protein
LPDAVRTLIGIFTAVWILVLVGTVVIFEFIVPLVVFHSFLDSVLKGVLASILGLVWLFLFYEMQNLMERTQLRIEKSKLNV